MLLQVHDLPRSGSLPQTVQSPIPMRTLNRCTSLGYINIALNLVNMTGVGCALYMTLQLVRGVQKAEAYLNSQGIQSIPDEVANMTSTVSEMYGIMQMAARCLSKVCWLSPQIQETHGDTLDYAR